jgi:hypothetical protein
MHILGRVDAHSFQVLEELLCVIGHLSLHTAGEQGAVGQGRDSDGKLCVFTQLIHVHAHIHPVDLQRRQDQLVEVGLEVCTQIRQ